MSDSVEVIEYEREWYLAWIDVLIPRQRIYMQIAENLPSNVYLKSIVLLVAGSLLAYSFGLLMIYLFRRDAFPTNFRFIVDTGLMAAMINVAEWFAYVGGMIFFMALSTKFETDEHRRQYDALFFIIASFHAALLFLNALIEAPLKLFVDPISEIEVSNVLALIRLPLKGIVAVTALKAISGLETGRAIVVWLVGAVVSIVARLLLFPGWGF